MQDIKLRNLENQVNDFLLDKNNLSHTDLCQTKKIIQKYIKNGEYKRAKKDYLMLLSKISCFALNHNNLSKESWECFREIQDMINN